MITGTGGRVMTGKTKLFEEKPIPVPLCPPQIPYGLPCPGVKASRNG